MVKSLQIAHSLQSTTRQSITERWGGENTKHGLNEKVMFSHASLFLLRISTDSMRFLLVFCDELLSNLWREKPHLWRSAVATVFPTYCQHGVRTLQQNHYFYPYQSLHCIIHIKRQMSCDVHVDLHGGVVSNSSVKALLYAQKVRIKFQFAEWHWRVDMLSTPSCDIHTSSNSHEKLSCFELLSLGSSKAQPRLVALKHKN